VQHYVMLTVRMNRTRRENFNFWTFN
jgi:hypothetical protein